LKAPQLSLSRSHNKREYNSYSTMGRYHARKPLKPEHDAQVAVLYLAEPYEADLELKGVRMPRRLIRET
jgi:hypothetical protein